jgi:hypothetical protein
MLEDLYTTNIESCVLMAGLRALKLYSNATSAMVFIVLEPNGYTLWLLEAVPYSNLILSNLRLAVPIVRSVNTPVTILGVLTVAAP